MPSVFPALVLAATLNAPGTPAVPIDSVFAHLPEAHATRLTGPITIDGVLDEPVWKQAEA